MIRTILAFALAFAASTAVSAEILGPTRVVSAAEPAGFSSEQAAADVSRVSKHAPKALERLASVPVEFASVLTVVPYGAVEVVAADLDAAKALAVLLKKEAYWKKRRDALRTAEETAAFRGEASRESASRYAAQSSGLRFDMLAVSELTSDAFRKEGDRNRYRALADFLDALLVDIAADRVFLQSGGSDGQALIERKRAFYQGAVLRIKR